MGAIGNCRRPAPGPIASAGGTTNESGVEVFRGANPEGDDTAPSDSTSGEANTAEIPSHGTPRKSPSKRHTLSSQLGNVQINILGLTSSRACRRLTTWSAKSAVAA